KGVNKSPRNEERRREEVMFMPLSVCNGKGKGCSQWLAALNVKFIPCKTTKLLFVILCWTILWDTETSLKKKTNIFSTVKQPSCYWKYMGRTPPFLPPCRQY